MYPSYLLSERDYRFAVNLLSRLDTRQLMAIVCTVLRLLQQMNRHY